MYFIVIIVSYIETRIEQAKRIQRNSDYIKLPKYDNENISSTSTAGLISIQRLPIPHKNKEHRPLVEYICSESERYYINNYINK